MGEPHRDEIRDILSMFDVGTPGGAATGGFRFTEAQMETIIRNWMDLAKSYTDSIRNSERMSRIRPPAEDFASQWHTVAANRSGEAYTRYLVRQRDYCFDQAVKSQNTLNDYLGVEHTNIIEMMNAGQQGPQEGV